MPHVESDEAGATLGKYPQLEAVAGGYQDAAGEHSVLRTEISGIASGNASAMSDVHDGHQASEMSVEMLTALTETVGKSARQFADMVKDKDESTARQLWNGFLDDLLGPKKGSS